MLIQLFHENIFCGRFLATNPIYLHEELRTAEMWISSTQTFGASPMENRTVCTERIPRGRDVQFIQTILIGSFEGGQCDEKCRFSLC